MGDLAWRPSALLQGRCGCTGLAVVGAVCCKWKPECRIRRLSSEDRYTLISERHGRQRRMRVECTTEVTSQLCVRVQCSRSRIPGSYISRQHPLSSPGFLSSTLPLQQVHTAALSTSKKPASLSEQLSSALLKGAEQAETPALDLRSIAAATAAASASACISYRHCLRVLLAAHGVQGEAAVCIYRRLLLTSTETLVRVLLPPYTPPSRHPRARFISSAPPPGFHLFFTLSLHFFLSTSSSPVRFSGHILCSFSQVRLSTLPSTTHAGPLLH